MKGPLYFGHPVNTYDTDLESDLIAELVKRFPRNPILNPNTPEHQEGYERWKRNTGKGMDYYYIEVLAACGGGTFLTFRDGAWGAGVYGEAKWFADHGLPVYEISSEGIIVPVSDLASVRALSVDETRTRIRNPDGSRKPY